jgi:hypothetical protein
MTSVLEHPSLKSDRQSPGWFLFVDAGGENAVRLWLGFGSIRLPADTVGTTGGIYRGLGALLRLPSFSIPINGAFSQFDIGLSGTAVTPEVVRLTHEAKADLQGAPVYLGLTAFDKDAKMLGPVAWIAQGVVDTPGSNQAPGEGGAVRTILLSATSGDPYRNARETAYWSGIDQRRRSPTDAFCDLTNNWQLDTFERWPT